MATWLASNAATAKELWVHVHKISSGEPSVTWDDCVVEAGCYVTAGTRVLTSAVPTQAERVGDAWHVALSNAETVQARTVVNAAGAWADEVAALFGAAPLGIEPRRRSAFPFRPP